MSYSLDEQLVVALRDRKFDEAEELLAKGANIDAQNVRGETPLHFFANAQNKHQMEWLIAHNANLNIQDNLGQTPLFIAVSHNELVPVDLLLSANADPNIANGRNINPLMQAVLGEKNKGVFQRLLDAPNIDIDVPSDAGTTPLVAAAARGHEDYVEILLLAGADPETVDYMGIGLMHAAVISRKAEVLHAVIEHAPILDPNYAARSGSTAVSETHGNPDFLGPLLKIGGDVNAKSGNRFNGGVSLLMNVLRHQPMDLPMRKSKNDSDPAVAMLGIMGGGMQHNIVDDMLERGASITERDDAGRNVGASVVSSGSFSVFNKLIAHGFDPKRPMDPSSTLPYDVLANPLIDHDSEEVLVLLEDLYTAGFPIERPEWDEKIDGPWISQYDENLSPLEGVLQSYAKVGFWAGVEKLLELGAPINTKNALGSTIAHTVVLSGFNGLTPQANKILSMALRAKNIDPATKEQQLAEIREEGSQRLESVRQMLQNFGIDWEAKNEAGQTPLHVAAKTGNKEWATFLMRDAQVDPTLRNSSGLTAAGEALLEGNIEAFHLLCESAKLRGFDVKSDAIYSAVCAAPEDFRERSKLVRALASYPWTEKEINFRGEEGKTALYNASGTDAHDVVRVLLILGALPNIASDEGNTPLMEAVFSEDGEIIRMLRAVGASVSQENNQGQTAQDVANFVKSRYVHSALDSDDLQDVAASLYAGPDSPGQKLMKDRFAQGLENIVREYQGQDPIPLEPLTDEEKALLQEEEQKHQQAQAASITPGAGAAMTAPRPASQPKMP